MRVVVDLDAARGFIETEAVGHALEQGALRGAFGELAAEGFARVCEGVADEIALGAALRDLDVDAIVGAGGKGFLDQLVLLEFVAEEYEAWRRAVFVELGEEGLEHFVL
jgi:hypothetical protein